MTTSRRELLRGAAAVFGVGAASSFLPTPAWANGELIGRNIAGKSGPYKVLEIFFSGGLSHRESLWVEQPDEQPLVRQLAQLDPQSMSVFTQNAPADWLDWLPEMGAFQETTSRVGFGSTGSIHLGPGCEPLVRPLDGGTRLIDRLRVIATGHGLAPHQPAQRYMVQGGTNTTANSRTAGIGAAIARSTNLGSYVFYDSSKGSSSRVAEFSSKPGRHGGTFAPTAIPFDDPTVVEHLLKARYANRDAMRNHYSAAYESRLVFGMTGTPASSQVARARSFEAYEDALAAAQSSPNYVDALSYLTNSGGNTSWSNGTRRAIQASCAMLSQGLSNYCCVCDGGQDWPYDTHTTNSFLDHAGITTRHVLNVMRTLHEQVNEGTLDLSDTVVVLNTEFGRNFNEDGETPGSNHSWKGFAVGVLGGPVTEGDGAVVGDLPFTSADDDFEVEYSNPALAQGGLVSGQPISSTDIRSAVLVAAGVHPFQEDVYKTQEANLPELTSPDDGADQLAKLIFG